MAVTGGIALVIGASAQPGAIDILQPAGSYPDLQDPPPTQQQDPPAQQPGRGGRQGGLPSPRPYDQVITKEAKTDDGIFKVHRIGETLYYEIPKAQLGKDFLWVTPDQAHRRSAPATADRPRAAASCAGCCAGDRVLLQNIDYSIVADPTQPIAQAVDDANNPAIIRAFNVAAYSPAGDPVIDVTPLFMTDVAGVLGARPHRRPRHAMPTARSSRRSVSFPENINVEVTQTFTVGDAPSGPRPARGGERGRGGMRGSSATVLTHHSMVKLPEKPMMPRLFDERVGYFTQGFTDYGSDEHRAVSRSATSRATASRRRIRTRRCPSRCKPIVYYVDPATPSEVGAVRQEGHRGLAAGVRGGRLQERASSPRKRRRTIRTGAPEDARYSVIRWLPSTTENASGPHIHDPRTGEILEADIQYYHNVQNLAKNWYFVQVGPLDPRAQKLPLPDELMGELMRYVVAHEVGHTLGFQHNMKASSTYTIEQIRDPKWVKEMGHTPTLMDYSRFNYVAQPEDKIDPAGPDSEDRPVRQVGDDVGLQADSGREDAGRGEADARQVGARAGREAVPAVLDAKARRRRSGRPDRGRRRRRCRCARRRSALKNLVARVRDAAEPRRAPRVGDPCDELEEVYGRMVGQWTTEMNHVVRVDRRLRLAAEAHRPEGRAVRCRWPKPSRRSALQFLLDNAFQTPTFMIRPEILRRIQPTGVVDRVRTAQNGIMNNLLQTRAARSDGRAGGARRRRWRTRRCSS